jgi:two-component system, chemotaxis family, response regulator PixG
MGNVSSVVPEETQGTHASQREINPNGGKTFRIEPKGFLEPIAKWNDQGLLWVSTSEIRWSIYWKFTRLVYVTNSIEPFERLERHLRRFVHNTPSLSKDIFEELRQRFEDNSQLSDQLTPDYQALLWLVQVKKLEPDLAEQVARNVSLEVLESYWLLPQSDYHVRKLIFRELPHLWKLELDEGKRVVEMRHEQWRKLLPWIQSPYQRPYLNNLERAQQVLSPAALKGLQQVLRGFNFRQLAMLMEQEDLAIANRLSPLVSHGLLMLHPPIAPFDKLPSFGATSRGTDAIVSNTLSDLWGQEPRAAAELSVMLTEDAQTKRSWRVVCIDDSPAMLQEIQRFLGGDDFEVTLLNDPTTALMKLNSLKPDLILLDVTMPEIDGYQVCRIIRKSSVLKTVPVVMVTGNKGFVDRTKARLAGCTDYLTKPFSQSDLLKLAFRYLS